MLAIQENVCVRARVQVFQRHLLHLGCVLLAVTHLVTHHSGATTRAPDFQLHI